MSQTPLVPVRHYLQFTDITADKVIRLVPPLILSIDEAAQIVALLSPLVRQFLQSNP